jgi:transposase
VPFPSTKPPLILDCETRSSLESISRSRNTARSRVDRALILLAYAERASISAIARERSMSRSAVNRVVNRALEIGAVAALDDRARPGRPSSLTAEARAWLVALACQKPKDLGYPHELWTIDLLVRHLRSHCQDAGHPSLSQVAGGTVSKILTRNKVRPHKVRYYLERRDPDFDDKMVQILMVYKEVELQRATDEDDSTVVISYDERPGIQAIESKAPDLPPVPGVHSTIAREFEYIRHGTSSLLAGVDLMTGHVHHLMRDRHRSLEFIEFLQLLDSSYPPDTKIRLILDNHSAHLSKETNAYLKTVPNRFDFVFTPVHGSWLNLIETLFSKMARSVLRHIRVADKEELWSRIDAYFQDLNAAPVILRWKHGIEDLRVA